MNRKREMAEFGRMSPNEFRQEYKHPVSLVLENVRSGLNVGSIFRSADAFRIEKIYCCGITPIPPHRDILKTALGATESVSWDQSPDAPTLVRALQLEGHQVWAIEQTTTAKPLQTFIPPPPGPWVFVLGNEVRGISQEVLDLCTGSVEVEQFGTKHSLNVAVCAGIVLYHCIGTLKKA